MNILLEVVACLGGANGSQFVHRGLKKLSNVQFDLLAQSWGDIMVSFVADSEHDSV